VEDGGVGMRYKQHFPPVLPAIEKEALELAD